MNIRNGTVFLLLNIVLGQSIASEQISPLYTSVLSAEESQYQTRDPLAFTKLTSITQSNETLNNQIIAREKHVVMISNNGVTVLERTSSGLVKRHEEFFESNKYGGSQQIFASPNGKYLVWQASYNFVELVVNDDFTVTHRLIPNLSNIYGSITSDSEQSFVFNNYYQSRYQAYQVTDEGLVQVGQLPASVVSNSTVIFNAKDQILVSIYSEWQFSRVLVFKANNGIFTETGRHEFATDGYMNGSGYDIDNDRLVIYRNSGIHDEFRINRETGTIDTVATTTDRLIYSDYLRDYSGIVSGDFMLIKRYQDYFLLKRDGSSYFQVEQLDGYEYSAGVFFNPSSNTQEYWINDSWALKLYKVEQNKLSLLQERSSPERGMPKIDSYRFQHSDDNHFVLTRRNDKVILLSLDKSKATPDLTGVLIDSPSEIDYNTVILKVESGLYLIASSTGYRLVSEDTQGHISVTAVKNWPKSLGNYLYRLQQLKVIDGYIYYAYSGLFVLKLQNNVFTVVEKLTQATIPASDLEQITAVVKLNNHIFALIPSSGKVLRLKQDADKLKVETTGTMPAVNGPYEEGRNRIFAGAEQGMVLTTEDNQNLRISSVTPGTINGNNYKKRIKFAANYSFYSTSFMLNDDVTGIWQQLVIPEDCCGDSSAMLIMDGHLVTITLNGIQNIQISKINTAPYLASVVKPIPLNQGVSSDIVLDTFLQDDENDSISYSGMSSSLFSMIDSKKLKFNGNGTGAGELLLTAGDGALTTELKLPYQINAAPALLKALPIVVANQNAPLQFELNDYIEDPEGSAVSFQTQTQNGFHLSKSGLLSGTATSLQSVTFPLMVSDKAGALFSTTLTVQVNAAPAITGNTNLNAKVGESYAIDLNTLIADAEKHKISLTITNLPAGLNLSGAVISGTPSTSGNYNLNVTATDELGARSQLALSLAIAAEDKKSGGVLSWGWLLLLMCLRVRRTIH